MGEKVQHIEPRLTYQNQIIKYANSRKNNSPKGNSHKYKFDYMDLISQDWECRRNIITMFKSFAFSGSCHIF